MSNIYDLQKDIEKQVNFFGNGQQLGQGMSISESDEEEDTNGLVGSFSLQGDINSQMTLFRKGGGISNMMTLDLEVRKRTDMWMNMAIKKTIEFIQALKGEEKYDFLEKKYAKEWKEKAEQKAKDKLEGKETDQYAEIRKKIMKEYWDSLTIEQKLELVRDGADLGLTAAKVAGQGLKKILSALLSSVGSGGQGKPKEQQPKKKKSHNKSSIGRSFIPELTVEDFEALYEAYKVKRKINKKLEEAKAEIIKEAGKIGEYTGAFAGRTRDDLKFQERCEQNRKQFLVARKRWELLKAAITKNEDTNHYQNKIKEIEYDLSVDPRSDSPSKVYGFLGWDLTKEGRLEIYKNCNAAIDDLNDLRQGIFARLTKLFASKPKQQELNTAQLDLVKNLTRIVSKNWGSLVSYRSRPTNVTKMGEEMGLVQTSFDKLKKAKSVAKTAADGLAASNNRKPEAQLFYEAIAEVQLDNPLSLYTTIMIIKAIEAKM